MPFFGVWISIVTAAVSAARLKVTVTPGVALSHVGDRLVAECEAQCAENPTLRWDTLRDVPLDGRTTRTEDAKSSLTFDAVTLENEDIFVCKGTCGTERGQNQLKVAVYSFPKDPVISGNDNLVPEQKASITCDVPDVYPPEYLTIEWLRNGQVVSKDDSNGGNSRSVQTVSSTYTFMPKVEDNGQAISCRATLQLAGLSDRSKTRESTVSLSVQSPPSKTTISVSPDEEPKEGDCVTISCQSDGVPACNMILRRQTNSQYAELQSSVGSSLSYTIPSVQPEDTGRYECEALNEHGSQNHIVQVMVRASPRNTTVQVSPSWNVPQGQSINVSCITVSFPAATAVLRRLADGKELSSPDCNFHLLNLTTSDAGPYLLNVSNALGHEIKRFNLSIMAPPSKTTISVSPDEEPKEGDCVTISCQSDRVPACNMILRRQTNSQYTELQSSVGSSLSYTIPSVQPEDTGWYECEALNEHGSQNHIVQVMVRASPRNTTVQVSPSWNVPQGQSINVSCITVSFPAATAVLRRLADGKELSSPDCNFHLLNLTTSDAGPYLLNVSNALGHEIKRFNLSIMAPPSKTTISVSPDEEPKEGDCVTISCQSDRVPACNMILRRQTNSQYTELQSSVGSSLSYTIPSVQPEDTGWYECEALNEHGSQNHIVQVMVRASPRNTTVQVSPSWNVPQGQSINVSCITVSFPAATAVLRRLADGKELSSPDCNFHLLNLTTSDAGPYLLNVSNALGHEIKRFNLSIMAPPSKTTISVSPDEEPKEGDYVTISCQSDGVPACNMILRRQTNSQYTELQSSVGSSLSYTIPSVQLEDTGRYECEALNEHGSQNHIVQVMVRASPRNTTVQVSPSWNVPQGQSINVSCITVSFPAATAVLRRLADGKELSSPDCNFHLLNLTTSDAGPYLLNVSNALGHEIKRFNLSIMAHTEETPVLNVTVSTVATAALLPAVAFLVHYLRKFSRTFSYKVGPSSVV